MVEADLAESPGESAVLVTKRVAVVDARRPKPSPLGS